MQRWPCKGSLSNNATRPAVATAITTFGVGRLRADNHYTCPVNCVCFRTTPSLEREVVVRSVSDPQIKV